MQDTDAETDMRLLRTKSRGIDGASKLASTLAKPESSAARQRRNNSGLDGDRSARRTSPTHSEQGSSRGAASAAARELPIDPVPISSFWYSQRGMLTPVRLRPIPLCCRSSHSRCFCRFPRERGGEREG